MGVWPVLSASTQRDGPSVEPYPLLENQTCPSTGSVSHAVQVSFLTQQMPLTASGRQAADRVSVGLHNSPFFVFSDAGRTRTDMAAQSWRWCVACPLRGHSQVYGWMLRIMLGAKVLVTLFDRRFDPEFRNRWRQGLSTGFHRVPQGHAGRNLGQGAIAQRGVGGGRTLCIQPGAGRHGITPNARRSAPRLTPWPPWPSQISKVTPRAEAMQVTRGGCQTAVQSSHKAPPSEDRRCRQGPRGSGRPDTPSQVTAPQGGECRPAHRNLPHRSHWQSGVMGKALDPVQCQGNGGHRGDFVANKAR